MRKTIRKNTLPLMLLLIAAACTNPDDSTGPTAEPPPPDPKQARQAVEQLDPSDPLNAIRALPGFGGFYLSPTGTPTLLLTPLANRAAIVGALGPLLQSVAPGQQVEVAPADYTANDLETWYQASTPDVLRETGVVFIDNDEESNRVTVGVTDLALADRVRALIRGRGAPDGAIRVQQVAPISEAITVRGVFRPVLGGVQINFATAAGSSLCTLGFNAFNPPATQRSFITNSHCTRTRGSIFPPTVYAQPLIPVTIGIEIEDPPFFGSPTFGCPPGRLCRRSDAARANYNTAATSLLGRLARTTALGSITINPAAPNWIITAEGIPAVGLTLNKVGRTTGWSAGPVTNTCVNLNVSGSFIIMICQDLVRANAGEGDSGSPVFSRNSSLTSNVTLRGIVWGMTTIGGLTHFAMSRLSLIEAELGPLTTF